jgi:hypothetical protein
MRPIVYLAGAIAGLSGADAIDWRNQAVEDLKLRGVEALSPMRAKDVLRNRTISGNFNDYKDLGAFFTSRGTGNPHSNHPMLHEAMPFRVDSLEEAIDSVAIILGR